MPSVVEICNMALSHIGARRIQSLEEATKEARKCDLLYVPTRDAALEDHDWGFARKRLTLAQLTDTYTGWDYAYSYPSDCIAPRKILDETGGTTGTSYDIDSDSYKQIGKVEYEVSTTSAKDNIIILTNKEDAELVYTARIENSTLFTPLFVAALSLRLATDLSQSLRSDLSLQNSLIQQYQLILFRARSIDSNHEHKKPDNVNVFTRARQ